MGGDILVKSVFIILNPNFNPHLRMGGDFATAIAANLKTIISIHTSVWEVTF